ncbi:MAG: hypothetical protein LBC96_06025 [Lachnospiraceae bacterium]|jgi:hypothetical protein|nr:hypothetical protein [Lachnospiraceae bacterium]
MKIVGVIGILAALVFFGVVSEDMNYLIYLILLAGPVFYYTIKNRYSGRLKRHEHEKLTEVKVIDFQEGNDLTRRVTKSSQSSIGMKYIYSNEFKSSLNFVMTKVGAVSEKYLGALWK